MEILSLIIGIVGLLYALYQPDCANQSEKKLQNVDSVS